MRIVSTKDQFIVLAVSPTTGRPGFFDCALNGAIIVTSRQPFLDAARVLLADGVNPSAVLVMIHAASGVQSLRAKISDAARLDVRTRHDGPPVFVAFDRAPSVAPGVTTAFQKKAAATLRRAA